MRCAGGSPHTSWKHGTRHDARFPALRVPFRRGPLVGIRSCRHRSLLDKHHVSGHCARLAFGLRGYRPDHRSAGDRLGNLGAIHGQSVGSHRPAPRAHRLARGFLIAHRRKRPRHRTGHADSRPGDHGICGWRLHPGQHRRDLGCIPARAARHEYRYSANDVAAVWTGVGAPVRCRRIALHRMAPDFSDFCGSRPPSESNAEAAHWIGRRCSGIPTCVLPHYSCCAG
jgi:hypothetical protein